MDEMEINAMAARIKKGESNLNSEQRKFSEEVSLILAEATRPIQIILSNFADAPIELRNEMLKTVVNGIIRVNTKNIDESLQIARAILNHIIKEDKQLNDYASKLHNTK